jgi:hypothetical protein
VRAAVKNSQNTSAAALREFARILAGRQWRTQAFNEVVWSTFPRLRGHGRDRSGLAARLQKQVDSFADPPARGRFHQGRGRACRSNSTEQIRHHHARYRQHLHVWDLRVNLSDHVDTIGIRQTHVHYDDLEVNILNRPQCLAGSSQCSDGIAVIRQSTADKMPNGRLVFNNKYLWNVEQLVTPHRLQVSTPMSTKTEPLEPMTYTDHRLTS